MLKFRTQRTRTRQAAGNLGTSLQRKTSWLVMGLLVFVVLVGQEAWRKQRANNPAPNDGPMVDNRVDQPAVAAPDENDGRTDDDRVAQAEPANPKIQPLTGGDLKLPGAKPLLDGETKRYFGDISSKLFDEVLDDAGYRPPDELNSMYTMLGKLARYDERDIELASIGRKTFVQLHQQPRVYRGEIVTVGGTVEMIAPRVNKPPFARDVDESLVPKKEYEVWIQPDGSRLPIVILCLDIPADYPTNLPAKQKVEIDATGYFFKRLGYASAQESGAEAAAKGMTNVYRSAPLILAKTIKVRTQPVVAAKVVEEDEGPAFLKGIPLPIPAKYVLPILGIGMVVLTALSAWAYKISRTSVLAGGPIVGRHRPEPEAEVKDLNSINLP